MAEAKIVGDVCIVTSALPYTQIEKLERYKPNQLSLTNEKGNKTFSIKLGQHPSFSRYGIIFNNTNQAGKALATIQLPNVEEKAEFVKETYGYALLSLNQLEQQLTEVFEQLEHEINQIESNITVT